MQSLDQTHCSVQKLRHPVEVKVPKESEVLGPPHPNLGVGYHNIHGAVPGPSNASHATQNSSGETKLASINTREMYTATRTSL